MRPAHILHDLLQLTGAIGFTWEYGLHFFERRVHQDARLAANPRRARQCARRPVSAWMSRTDVRTQKRSGDAFRAEVRSFVAEHGHPMRGEGLRVPVDAAEEQAIRTWLASLYERRLPGRRLAGRVGRPGRPPPDARPRSSWRSSSSATPTARSTR